MGGQQLLPLLRKCARIGVATDGVPHYRTGGGQRRRECVGAVVGAVVNSGAVERPGRCSDAR